ncbi:MAG: hypothetical protein L0Z50_38950 [Verrucomicrobiales bacterium]|nr:hypothetical protein [Verrucomicrobiales bacterium]
MTASTGKISFIGLNERPQFTQFTQFTPGSVQRFLVLAAVPSIFFRTSAGDSANNRSDAALHSSAMTLVVRTASGPLGLASAVQDAVWNLNRNVPVSSVTTLESVVSNTVWQQRFNPVLIALFAVLALTLAMEGMYGVMAYAVAQRTHEIAIRMALGAEKRDVFRLVVSQGMILALIGTALGVLGALGIRAS